MSTEEEAPVVVKMRSKAPLEPVNEMSNQAAQSALMRGLEALQEGDTSEDTEEIRKLDTQLDHLNDYMGKVEERLREHNKRLMETLEQQKAEREKRRQSFHERMQTTQQEDNDFQQQMAAILGRVNNMRNRASVYDVVNQMDIPKLNGSS